VAAGGFDEYRPDGPSPAVACAIEAVVKVARLKPEAVLEHWLTIALRYRPLESEVMPVLAASAPARRCPMCLSSRLEMSLALESRPEAVKKLVVLSSALLTFLPEARRPAWSRAAQRALQEAGSG